MCLKLVLLKLHLLRHENIHEIMPVIESPINIPKNECKVSAKEIPK